MNRSVLITGINGFIGKHAAAAFLKAGFAVCGADLSSACACPGVRYAACDLTDANSAAAALQELQFDCIVHLAAVLAMDSAETLRINTTATYQMLLLAKERACRSFFHLSSIPVIGLPPENGCITEEIPVSPRSAYHVSKYASELLVSLPEFAGMLRYNIRIPSPVGPGMPHSFLRVMMERAAAGEPLTLHGTGSRIQNYVDARDIAAALVSAAEKEPEPGLYLLSGESCSNAEAASLCVKAAHSESSTVVFSGKPDPADGECWLVNSRKAREAFGYLPEYTLLRSMKDLWEELK